MDSSEIKVAGIRSPILQVGDATSAEAAVFVHGNPGSTSDWLDLLQHVAPFGRGIAMDMPGFGKAEKPKDFDYTVEGYAAHLGRVLDAMKVERAHLVLHDFGGAWGLAWASRNVERTRSVTLIDIGIMPGFQWHYLARIWRTPLVGELFMATTTRWGLKLSLKHGNPRGLPGEYFNEMYDNFDAGTRQAVLKLYRNSSDLAPMIDGWAAALAPIKLPALVIWGAQDPYVPVRFAEVQRQFFDVKQVLRLEDSGHWPMIDNPAAVREAVVPFLRARMQPSNI